jgi:hypothetical protein
MEYLDLDSGTVQQCDLGFCEQGVDLHVAYNAGRIPHSVVFQDFPAEIAHVVGIAFADVTGCDAQAAVFHQDVLDVPFDEGLVILIRTDQGATFKLGNPIETDLGLTFDAVLLIGI